MAMVSPEWAAFAQLHDTLSNVAIGMRLTIEACDLIAIKRREGVEVEYFGGNEPDDRVRVSHRRPLLPHDHVVHELTEAVQLMDARWIPAVWQNLRPAIDLLDGIPESLAGDLDVAAGTRWIIFTRRVLNWLIRSPSPYCGHLAPRPEQAGFPRNVSDAVYVCNHGPKRDDWRQNLGELEKRISELRDCQPPLTPSAVKGGDLDDADVKMAWQEAAQRLELRRKQGEPFTSQAKLADEIGCSSATVNKAINNTEALRIWAHRDSRPAAQSLEKIVIDQSPQCTECSPEDEAAIHEFLEQAEPEVKGWFLGLSTQQQIAHLNDPDANISAVDQTTGGKGRLHERLFSRRP